MTDAAIEAKRQAEEEAMEASRAPLMTHLLELRSRLMWSLGALIVAFAICFSVAKPIYEILVHPYEQANQAVYQKRLETHQAERAKSVAAALKQGTVKAQAEAAFDATHPAPEPPKQLEMVFTHGFGFFFVQLKVALFGAIMLAFPIIAYQAYRFMAPGLFKHERDAVWPFLVAAPLMFAAGAAFVYFVAMPFAMEFALKQEITEGAVKVRYLPKVDEYLSLITTLILAFGFCFQLPVALTLLGKAGLVRAKMLRDGRRYAVVGIFALAACVSPPDVISMCIMAAPIWVLYEISILCVWIAERGHARNAMQATPPAP